jgi:hypothetical protein
MTTITDEQLRSAHAHNCAVIAKVLSELPAAELAGGCLGNQHRGMVRTSDNAEMLSLDGI